MCLRCRVGLSYRRRILLFFPFPSHIPQSHLLLHVLNVFAAAAGAEGRSAEHGHEVPAVVEAEKFFEAAPVAHVSCKLGVG